MDADAVPLSDSADPAHPVRPHDLRQTLLFCRREHLDLRGAKDLLCAASATGGGVAVPNEFPAAAEAPYPREARWAQLVAGCAC